MLIANIPEQVVNNVCKECLIGNQGLFFVIVLSYNSKITFRVYFLL